jgi:hypothetical protein
MYHLHWSFLVLSFIDFKVSSYVGLKREVLERAIKPAKIRFFWPKALHSQIE